MTEQIVAHPHPKHKLFKDLTGHIFGRLTTVSYAGTKTYGVRKRHSWNCLCECGALTVVVAKNLRSGASSSCGCYQIESNRTHGLTETSEYRSWRAIKTRCHNRRNPAYIDYGGRGITVCKEWTDSFEAFYSDMGAKPSPSHSIDRIDNDKGYSKDNCRWATPKEQANNKRQYKLRGGLHGVDIIHLSNGVTWSVRITRNKKVTRLGRFDDWFEAVCARKSAENKGV